MRNCNRLGLSSCSNLPVRGTLGQQLLKVFVPPFKHITSLPLCFSFPVVQDTAALTLLQFVSDLLNSVAPLPLAARHLRCAWPVVMCMACSCD